MTASYEESLVERDEVLFPSADLIDNEPLYKNFTTIENHQRHGVEHKQTDRTAYQRSHSSDDQHRAVRRLVESSSSRHYHSNEMLWQPTQVPMDIQSKRIDGHVFNLIRIVEDIGHSKTTPFMRTSSPDPNTKHMSALLNIVLKMGGAQGPLVNAWRSRIDDAYYQRWYLEKQMQRSASTIQRNETTTQIPRDSHQSTIVVNNSLSPRASSKAMHDEHHYDNEWQNVYGYGDVDTVSTVSSQASSSFNELESKNSHLYANEQSSPLITSILKKGQQRSPVTHRVTIRDENSASQFNPSASMQHTNGGSTQILTDYQQFLREHPELNNDPNPQIIVRPNPDQVTYQQNVSVRYLVPPTPPPPGPLIIREIVPPRMPAELPLVVKYQEPSPPTPPPLILREAPPRPPPLSQQEPTVITRVLPPEPQPPRRVIIERNPPRPPKPQPIIIEKWLPYKPAPPREVIYQRVEERADDTEFEQMTVQTDRQRRHSAEFQSRSPSVSIPVRIQRTNSMGRLDTEQQFFEHQTVATGAPTPPPQGTASFDQLAWSSHQQILAMQQRGREQVEAHRQWAANQWQNQTQMFMQYQPLLMPQPQVMYQAPMHMGLYEYREEVRQQQVQYHPSYVYHSY